MTRHRSRFSVATAFWLSAAGLGATACQPPESADASDTESDANDSGGAGEALCREPSVGTEPIKDGCFTDAHAFWAGQHMDAGQATVTNDGETLWVSLNTNEDFDAEEIHLYAAVDPLPAGKRAAPGEFPFHHSPESPVDDYEFAIPLEELGIGCGDTVSISLHADLGEETGWAHGEHEFDKGWGWWFEYEVCCAEPAEVSDGLDRFVVGFEAPPQPEDLERLEQAGVTVVDSLDIIPAVVCARGDDDTETTMETLGQLEGVTYVEQDATVQAMSVPDDPLFAYQWGLHNWGYAGGVPGTDIDGVEAWDLSMGNPDIRVGVIDGAVEVGHPDLSPNIWHNAGEVPDNGIDDDQNGYIDDVNGYDFVEDDGEVSSEIDPGHGTQVAGAIAAVGDNGIGVAGVAWSASLLSLRVLDEEGTGRITDVIRALEYANSQDVRVVSMAFSSLVKSEALDAAIVASPALVVTAAGNHQYDLDSDPVYPAASDAENLITVGALDLNNELACFSNYGKTTVDLVAPGTQLPSTLPGADYGYLTGTSASVAYTVGTACLVADVFPSLDAVQIKEVIVDTVTPVEGLEATIASGGRLNAYDALGCAAECHTDLHCDDGLHCNGAEVCVEGLCEEGEAVDCSDTRAGLCEVGVCDEESDSCVTEAATDGSSCEDGDACNGEETCMGGNCLAGETLECGESGPCEESLCDPQMGCVSEPVSDGTSCGDDDACNGEEVCQAGLCQKGQAPTCADGNPCTQDGCDPSSGCTFGPMPDGSSCADGDPCDGAETCAAGNCVAALPLDCEDPSPCRVGFCDPVQGCAFVAVDDGTSCSDGNQCNGEETCNAGVCGAGEEVDCDDGAPCTADSCDPEAGCQYAPAADGTSCEDGNACNGAETCSAGACGGSESLECESNGPCTVGACDPEQGCVQEPVVDGVPCSDGDACNGYEVCSAGACAAGPPLDCEIEDPCMVGLCDPILGCSVEPVMDGTECDDGDACNGIEACESGACTFQDPPDCDDQDDCTDDMCDPLSGCEHEVALGCEIVECEMVNDGEECDDGSVCNGIETCNEGVCAAGEAIVCDDENPCTADSCDAIEGCVHTPVVDGVSCADEDACNGEETCQAGTCSEGEVPDCDDDNPCTDDTCDPGPGCKHAIVCGEEVTLLPDDVEPDEPVEPLQDPEEEDPLILDSETGYVCEYQDMGPNAEIFGAEALIQVRKEFGATGTVNIEINCDGQLLASAQVDLDDIVDDFEGGGLMPSQIVVPIPGVDENVSLLNCLDVGVTIEDLDVTKQVFWSYTGVNVHKVTSCEVDADCIDELMCNGVESCIEGICRAGDSMPCGHLSDGCHIGICYEPAQGCVPVPIPGQGCGLPTCGNGLLDDGEECDLGEDNSNEGACTFLCESATCSDGLVWNGQEACDDGNVDDDDACSSNCQSAYCGDGNVWESLEECDDGNQDDGDDCLNGCMLASCGDGQTWAGEEECDDGNGDDQDGCLATCEWARCGDGFTYAGVEECDDGNQINGDGCETNCQSTSEHHQSIELGRQHSCVLSDDGTAHCWGDGTYGQLGYGDSETIGDDEEPWTAGIIDVGAPVTSVAAGGWHTCGLTNEGGLKCWGLGNKGQLGYADTENVGDDELPSDVGYVDVGDLIVQVSGGDSHTCAVLQTGEVRCWGLGDSGRLGYGNTDTIGDDEAPATAGSVNLGGSAKQVSAGRTHTCALLDTGVVRCWGDGTHGALGYGNGDSIGDDEHPVSAGDVQLGGHAAQISAGDYHTCAVLDDGMVRCWGHGGEGRLGYGNGDSIGDDEDPSVAGDVPLTGPAVSVAAGFDHTCAVLESGDVQCWGAGTYGQTGYATTETIGDDEFPSDFGLVDAGGNVRQVAVELDHTCALFDDQRVRCWGRAKQGQLGYALGMHIGDDEVPATASHVHW